MGKLFVCDICGKETNKICECDSCYRSFCPDCGGVGESICLCNECMEQESEETNKDIDYE